MCERKSAWSTSDELVIFRGIFTSGYGCELTRKFLIKSREETSSTSPRTKKSWFNRQMNEKTPLSWHEYFFQRAKRVKRAYFAAHFKSNLNSWFVENLLECMKHSNASSISKPLPFEFPCFSEFWFNSTKNLRWLKFRMKTSLDFKVFTFYFCELFALESAKHRS